MALRQFHVGLSATQTRMLEKLAAKLGLDKSNTIRYCISRIAEQENLSGDLSGKPGFAAERESRR
jgi:hypothetical protein